MKQPFELAGRVFIAGHNGLVGSALTRALSNLPNIELIYASKQELDLRDSHKVKSYFSTYCPDYVILAAAKVGGIGANEKYPADFIYDNLMIQSNVIHNCFLSKVKKLIFLGSSCVYPRDCPQPMKEEHLLSGTLEPTNEAYAIAKIAGLKMATYYEKQYRLPVMSLIPCNLYGPNDSFDLETSHVLSALVRKFIDARNKNDPKVSLWGTGTARREFMHVDDFVSALLFLMPRWPSSELINVGTGSDLTIRDLAQLIASQTGYKGIIEWDPSKPDGMPRKCLDISKLQALGYQPKISISDGVDQMIATYLKQIEVIDDSTRKICISK